MFVQEGRPFDVLYQQSSCTISAWISTSQSVSRLLNMSKVLPSNYLVYRKHSILSVVSSFSLWLEGNWRVYSTVITRCDGKITDFFFKSLSSAKRYVQSKQQQTANTRGKSANQHSRNICNHAEPISSEATYTIIMLNQSAAGTQTPRPCWASQHHSNITRENGQTELQRSAPGNECAQQAAHKNIGNMKRPTLSIKSKTIIIMFQGSKKKKKTTTFYRRKR